MVWRCVLRQSRCLGRELPAIQGTTSNVKMCGALWWIRRESLCVRFLLPFDKWLRHYGLVLPPKYQVLNTWFVTWWPLRFRRLDARHSWLMQRVGPKLCESADWAGVATGLWIVHAWSMFVYCSGHLLRKRVLASRRVSAEFLTIDGPKCSACLKLVHRLSAKQR